MPDGEPSRAVQSLGGKMVSAPSLLFSPGKYRRAKHSKRSILAVAKAVVKVMQEELPAGSLERWPELIDAQLGESLFTKLSVVPYGPSKRRAPLAEATAPASPLPAQESCCCSWAPSKPKLTKLILEAFQCNDPLPDGEAAVMSATTVDGRDLSKFMLKRALEMMRRAGGNDRLLSCGELPADVLDSPVRLDKAVNRAAADALVYVHSAAAALRGTTSGEGACVLELQTSDQRLSGVTTRGSGVVFCQAGRRLFDQALGETVEQLDRRQGPAATA